MPELTAAQATLLVGLAALLGGVIGWLGRGLSFLLTRWWTGAPKQEDATYLNTVADIAVKLRAHGMSIEEVHQLEAIMRSPGVVASPNMHEVVEELAATEEPGAFQSNVAMKGRAGAAYSVAEAKLAQAVLDLELLLEPHEAEALEVVQERWFEYRRALEDFALREFQGGTHAPLAMTLAGMSETDRRTNEILAEVAERSNR